MAVLKEAGYRSAANYVSRAKEEHVKLVGTWPCRLEEAARLSARSAVRGIGPARQSAPLDLHRLEVLGEAQLGEHSGLPIGAVDLVVMGSFFLAREIEISLAMVQHVAVAWVD